MTRRLVVVLFLDLVGWTRLAEQVDPEPLQLLLEQYYEICSTAVEEHGGVVEKFIGDAVMAVFGAASSQEDDALRALRTAFQIRADVGDLLTPGSVGQPPEVHCGIAAGEALVSHSPRAGLRVVGDVVNLAARLQSVATAGEIIVNETTAHLAGAHVTMLPVAPLILKGKARPVPALLAVGPVEPGDLGDDGSPMVDRRDERARLVAAYHEMIRAGRPWHVLVSGPPGIGKSRLVREALVEMEATAVVGSCPSYGPHGDHLALGQVLDHLTRRSPACAELIRANDRIATVLDSLRRAVLARPEYAVPGPGLEEFSWAARELITAAASAGPLVLVWDSLEWAGPSLLRLIDDLAGHLAGLPVLTISVSRPEPTMRRRSADAVIDVGALAPIDSAELAALLAAGRETAEVMAHDLGVLDRVTSHGAGNPLFIRLLVESATPGRSGDEVPPTITAMVGAMIDRLPAPVRDLLGAASVIGSTFTLGQLVSLGDPVPAADLDTLVERQLVRRMPTAEAYSFVQQAVHEVTYGRLHKKQRLTWHRLLAEQDVGPAFHLEAAVRLLGDLRPHDPELVTLTGSACRALVREGTVALRQRDVPAAIALLGRALDLRADGLEQCHGVAAIRLSDALLLTGNTRRAVEVVTATGGRSPDARVRRACLMQSNLLSARLGGLPATTLEQLRQELADDPADRFAGCRFEQLRMLLHLRRGRFGAAERATRTALAHARAIGDRYEEDRLLVALCEVRQWSPTPIAERLLGCVELADRFAADRFLLVPVLVARARGLALIGEFDDAEAALAEARAAVEQLRLTMGQVLVDQASGLLRALAGAHAEAEQHFRRAAGALETAGHAPSALTLRVRAARELARQGPDGAGGEIGELLRHREEMDVQGRLLCLSTAAWTSGDGRELIDEVMDLLAHTDDPCLRGDVYADLARARHRLGDHPGSEAMALAAIDSYAVIGATAPQRSVRPWT
ncbi:AAA family ATPase [Micromonosporaceae bacterium Da 78-11]